MQEGDHRIDEAGSLVSITPHPLPLHFCAAADHPTRCVFLKEKEGVVQAVIVAEKGASYSWLRWTTGVIQGFALTEVTPKVVVYDWGDGGRVRWPGSGHMRPYAYDLSYSRESAFNSYLQVFDLDGCRKARNEESAASLERGRVRRAQIMKELEDAERE